MDTIPYELGKQVLKIGKVEWGALEPKTDDELVEWFKENLAKTRKHFGLTEEKTTVHGLFLQGTGIILCECGMSPNAAVHSQALVGAWNRLVDDCEAQKRPVARKG